MTKIREELEAIDPELILLEPAKIFDKCILGLAERNNGESVVAYDQNKIIKQFVKEGMSDEEAEEYFYFNTLGSWMGPKTPVFVCKL